MTSYEKREKIIPIPTDNYTKVLLLGTTGAGKTTLLRQIIGTDPEKERFPSTSPSSTTIHDIEIITGDFDKYQAVVTFVPINETQLLIEECVKDAIIAFIATKSEDEMMRRFLTHKDNRFRLGYIIGKPYSKVDNEYDDVNTLFADEDVQDIETPFVQSEIIQNRLEFYKQSLIAIANSTLEKVSSFFNIDIHKAAKDEKETVIELIDETLYKNDQEDLKIDFSHLVGRLLDDVRQKFALVENGDIKKNDYWFDYWTFETNSRSQFIKTLYQFSANKASDFGKLFTPIVDGIRIKGKFKTNNDTEFRNLVIIDGEGLGQTPETSPSLPNYLTQKFSQVDAIILVDTAQNPMLAAPTAAIQSIVKYASETKLILAFTHFDQVKGDTFVNLNDRKNFVLNNIQNTLDKIEKEIGRETKRELKEVIDKNIVFLSNLHEIKLDKLTISELKKLIGLICDKNQNLDFQPTQIVYDGAFLDNYIIKAITDFHEKWDVYLGLANKPDYGKLHWMLVKSITKRISILGWDGYGDYKPCADLADFINKNIRLFIETSIIEPSNFDKENTKSTKQIILISSSQKIQAYVLKKLLFDQLHNWKMAYHYTGVGSPNRRYLKIKEIYNKTTLNPREDLPLKQINEFIEEIKKIMKGAIEQNNCKLI